MGYEELKGTDQDAAQITLKKIMELENTVTMIVMGTDQAEIARIANEVADEEPNTWYVVWLQNTDLLTKEQIKKYKGDSHETVVCVLSPSGVPVRRLPAENAQFKDQLLAAFNEAQAAA